MHPLMYYVAFPDPRLIELMAARRAKFRQPRRTAAFDPMAPPAAPAAGLTGTK
ncbi:MAG: hypothetical protein HZY75_07140 [Nocardioidaceae bacterium]|nr:MAG: hypothetical protein HZY75_07140 [Nocardioidaceae bacterium]